MIRWRVMSGKWIPLLSLMVLVGACTGNPLLGSSGSKFARNHLPFLSSPGNFELLTSGWDSSTVTLRWTASQNATRYSVWYRIAGDQAFTLVSDEAVSPFRVTGLKVDATYEFRVTAKNDHGTLDSRTITLEPAGTPVTRLPFQLAFAVEPQASTPLVAGQPLFTPVKVQVLDQSGEVTSNGAVQIELSLFSDSECKIPLPTTLNQSPSLSGTTVLVSDLGIAEAPSPPAPMTSLKAKSRLLPNPLPQGLRSPLPSP
ncbi:MAG: fibronectin type III domain-containing protein, partial [Proteobacteria bacterium]|nr:fibronectin type III domain-containing protein [Pseudomonadota bacterium]